MLKKVSLSAMVFTYLFSGIAHFTRLDYFLSLAPRFLSHSYAYAMVGLMGLFEILFSLFLVLPVSRRGACYGILLLWSMSLPLDAYILYVGGAGIPLPHWELVGMILFHLFLIAWACWHIQPEKAAVGPQFSGT